MQTILQCIVIGIICNIGNVLDDAAIPQAKARWGSSTYKNIVIGKTSRSEVLKHFGVPKWQGDPIDQAKNDVDKVKWYKFDTVDTCLGKVHLTVEVRKKTDKVIALWVEMINGSHLDMTDVTKCLGGKFIETHYSLCPNMEGESIPMYEDEEGTIRFLEDRSRGIAISVDENNNIREISFTNQPIGVISRSYCRKIPIS